MENPKRGIVPRKIKGFRDIDPSLNQLKWLIVDGAKKVYKAYGFEHWDTPILEYADSLGKYMPGEANDSAGEVAEGVYSFRNPEIEPVYDENGNELRDRNNFDKVVTENHHVALRYDLTAPLARLYAEQLWQEKLKGLVKTEKSPLFRRYQFGPVFRFEVKIDPGRFREFWQLDFDTVGTADMIADAEVCMVTADALEEIGLKRGTYIVKVNNRKVLKGFLKNLGVSDEEQEKNILRVVDKIDKIGFDGMKQELGKGRLDSSGAEVKGLGLSAELVNGVVDFFKKFGEAKKRLSVLEQLSNLSITNTTFTEGVEELKQIDSVLTAMGFNEKRVVFDPTLVRGMSYYTGPVFEVESKQTYLDEKGNEKRVGSICGGGRYDDLVEKLLGIKVPATGLSIGVDRLAELLQLTNQAPKQILGPVLIIVFDINVMTEYQRIALQLRKAKIDTEVYYGFQKGLNKQLAYADKKNCPVAILMGGNEISKGVVTVRDLKKGKDIAADFTDKTEWMKTAQFEVKREDLVKKVKELIKKYK
ncbi:MAG: histidine--tRNA ligase [Saprospiraceae bacterium]|nr:histidine--tRNA ligase [Saprospiraceae bacterium]